MQFRNRSLAILSLALGLLAAPVRADGPKPVVAVQKFTAVSHFTAEYGDADIGGGLAAMMAAELVRAGFPVVERANLDAIQAEHALVDGGGTAGDGGARSGSLVGAQIHVFGNVTHFGPESKGGGLRIGVGLGRFRDSRASLSRKWAKGRVTIDIRVVDATTGRVLANFTVSEKVERGDWNLGVNFKQVEIGTDSFEKTPLGDAARRAIENGVRQFARVAAKAPWRGRVAAVDEEGVYINAGRNAGLKAGDVFRVERIAKTLTDPTTGEVLGRKRVRIGTLRVREVEEQYAVAEFRAAGDALPERGDLVVR